MKSKNAARSVWFLSCLCWICSCNSVDKTEAESSGEASAIVTSEWPDGTSRRIIEVAQGDTVSISLFDAGGQLTKYGEWKNSERHGASRAFYPNGTPWSEHTYKNGTQIGPYRTWHPNGKPFIIGQYDDGGNPYGTWQFFDDAGELIQEQSGESIQP